MQQTSSSYRYLENGEIIEAGDEFESVSWGWIPVAGAIGCRFHKNRFKPIRRSTERDLYYYLRSGDIIRETDEFLDIHSNIWRKVYPIHIGKPLTERYAPMRRLHDKHPVNLF